MNEMSFFSDNLVDVFAMTMIHSLWQGAIIVLIVGMTLKLLPRLQAQLQYSVFLAGLMSLLIAVIATFSIQMIGDTNDTSPILQQDLIPERTFATGITEQTFVFSWQEAAALIWFLGSMIFLLRALVGTLQIWKIRKNSYKADLEWQWLISSLQRKLKINQKVKILVSDDCLIPFVWGVFKSVIVVPSMYFTRLSQQEIESILLHELTHIRRRDFLVNLVQIIIESLLFFNPATWWLSGQMKRQREFCCDDSVQQQMSNQSTYLKALYKVALFSINERPDYSIALFKQNSELIMRMKRMLNTPVRHTGNQTIFTASIGVLVVGLMFTLDVAFGQQSETTKEDVKNKVEIYKHEVKPGEQKIVITPVVSPKVNVTSVSPETDMHVSVAPMPTSMEVASPVIRVHPVIKTQVAPVVSQVDVQISRPDVHIEVAPVIATDLHFSVVDSPEFAHDTLPTSPRLEELTRQMEVKAEEMERLAESMEELMEESIEPDIEEIERLAEKLEELQEGKMDEMEDLHNSATMERLEKLSDEMEELMGNYSEKMEDSFPEELVESITEEMERTAEKYESDEPLTEDQRKKLAAEMKTLQEKLQSAMQQHELNMKNIQQPNREEMQRLQKEMEAAQKEIEPMHRMHEQIWSEEAKAIQKEMHQVQSRMEEKMHSSNNEIQMKMEQKSKEMQELAREIEIEYQRLKKEKG